VGGGNILEYSTKEREEKCFCSEKDEVSLCSALIITTTLL
jgi:hypothetical protein